MSYYNSEYKLVSQSMLKVFMKSKEYYYKKFIEKSIKEEESEAYKIGTAVDKYVKNGADYFFSNYSKKVLKKDFPELYDAQQNPGYSKTLLSDTSYETVMAISDKLLSIPDVQFINQHCLKDMILSMDERVGELDYLFIDGEKAIIIDLKTSENIDKRPFFWKAVEYGYFTQMAYYRALVKHNYPGVKTIQCYLLAAEKDRHMPRALFYEVPATEMDKQDLIIDRALRELNDCLEGREEWEDPIPTFKGAQELILTNDTYNEII